MNLQNLVQIRIDQSSPSSIKNMAEGTIYDEELTSLELSSKEEVSNIIPYDKNVQLVASFINVKSPSTTATGKTYMKGTLKTMDDIISFIVWEENIKKHQDKIKPGVKCLIENIYIKPFDIKYEKSSTVGIQCNFQSNTLITWINQMDLILPAERQYQLCKLEEVCQYDGYVELSDAYLRSQPSIFEENGTNSIRLCSVTDGRVSLEIRFNCDGIYDLKKGDPVIVKGLLVEKANPPYIVIQESSNFMKKKGVESLSIAQTTVASKAVKRKSDFNENNVPSKLPKSG